MIVPDVIECLRPMEQVPSDSENEALDEIVLVYGFAKDRSALYKRKRIERGSALEHLIRATTSHEEREAQRRSRADSWKDALTRIRAHNTTLTF